MFARDLHVLLAILTIATALIATLEGAVRFVRGYPANIAADRTRIAVVMAAAMTATAGIALLISGKRPGEWLHLIYAALVFSMIPLTDNAAETLRSHRGKALARVGGGLTCLLVITRLFATG
jgi:hypothetical protein